MEWKPLPWPESDEPHESSWFELLCFRKLGRRPAPGLKIERLAIWLALFRLASCCCSLGSLAMWLDCDRRHKFPD